MIDEEKITIEEEMVAETAPQKPSRILMVVTNVCEFNDKEHTKTGVWFEEFAVPYNEFKKNGFDVAVATLTGEIAPIDPECENLFEDIIWNDARKALNDTEALDTIDSDSYDAIVLPGGHGPMFDLAKSEVLGDVINRFNRDGKLIAAICHGPAGLLPAKENGIPFVSGRKLTSFTNEEERYYKKDKLTPFFLQDALLDEGASFIEDKPGAVNVITDGNLITAQNFQSAKNFAKAIIDYLAY